MEPVSTEQKSNSTRDSIVRAFTPSLRTQQARPGAVTPPAALPEKELINRSRILCGIPKRHNADNNDSILQKAYPILKSNIPGLVILDVVSLTTTTAHEATSARHIIGMKEGWTKGAINVAVPHTSIELGLSNSRSQLREIREETQCFMAVNTFGRLRLSIDLRVARNHLDPQFVRDLDEALGEKDKHRKRSRLSHLFTYYGDVIGTEVIMGGERRAWREESSTSERDIDAIRRQVFAAVSSQSAPVQASLGNEHSEHRTNEDHLNRKDLHHRRVGGDPRYQDKDDSYEIWRNSVEDSNYWDIIRVQRVTPILDLLPEEKRKAVIGAFGPPLQVKLATKYTNKGCRHLNAYCADIGADDFNAGWRSLGYTRDSSKVLMIKQRDAADNALREVASSRPIWRLFHSWDCHFRRLDVPGGYKTLGILVGRLDRNQMRELCVVRENLLAPARLEDRWRSKFRVLRTVRGSVWGVISNTDGDQDITFDIGSFEATIGTDRPTMEVWGIKKEYIEELNGPISA